jgi:hypothetical protein
VFHGKARKLSSYKKNIGGKTIYLVDPTNIVSVISVLKYVIPEKLLSIHAFHKESSKVVEINNKAKLFN